MTHIFSSAYYVDHFFGAPVGKFEFFWERGFGFSVFFLSLSSAFFSF